MKCCNCDREATKKVVFMDGWKKKSFDFCKFCHCAWNWGWAVRDDGCVIVDDGCDENYFAGNVGEEKAIE